MWIVTVHRQFDERRPCGGCTADDLCQTLDDELTQLLGTATRRLRALQLTDTDTTILKAFLLFFAGTVHSSTSPPRHTHNQFHLLLSVA